ncbi:MAG: transposase [Candidatus Glassbacteria bacterium]
MPNHLHGLIFILDNCGGDACVASTPKKSGPPKGSIGAIIGSFKSAATNRINVLRGLSRARIWQRGYYEHVVRRTDKMNRIREYISKNPLRWELDRENPDNLQNINNAKNK